MAKRIRVYLKGDVNIIVPSANYETDYWWPKEKLEELNDRRCGDYIEFGGNIFRKEEIDRIIVEEVPEKKETLKEETKQEDNMPF